MREEKFDYSRARWDEWKAFHISQYGCFVRFETGEMVVRSMRFDPGDRHEYSDHGVGIFSTTDSDCPSFTTPDGKPVKKVWLDDGGAQTLLVDYKHKRAVRLDGWAGNDAWQKPIPERFQKSFIRAYYAGPNSIPLGQPIRISRPKVLTLAEKRHIQTLIEASKAWYVMMELDKRPRPPRVDPVATGLVCDIPYTMLLDDMKVALAVAGTTPSIEKSWHKYLQME